MKWSRVFSFLWSFLLIAPCLLAATVYELTDRNKIYFGSAERIASPSVIEIQKVYDALPSYQEAMKHPEGSAKRIHGLKKASDEFRELVSKVSKEKKYEFVAEKGVLQAHDSSTKKSVPIPDMTQDAIKAIDSE